MPGKVTDYGPSAGAWTQLEAFAVETVIEAGREALPFFRTRLAIGDKSAAADFDPVTAADVAVEAVIRQRIREHYPGHGLLGEERGHEPGAEAFEWVIDPIDGTRSFVCGFLHWGVLLALTEAGDARLGVIHQPWTDELWIGRPGAAEYRCGARRERLAVRACRDLDEACMATTDPTAFAYTEARALNTLMAATRLRRFGGDCYAYCMLAAGHLDLVVESGLSSWDIQALIPVIEGAGGLVTDWRGAPVRGGGRILAAADSRVHARALETLAAVPENSMEAR